MMGRRPQSSDGNALFHAALRKRNEDMSTATARVVHKNEEEENQFLPPLPQHRHIGRKRPSDEAALNCDFKYLLIRHGSVCESSIRVARARQQQYTDKMKRLAKAESERQKVIEVQQVIKLSNTTGHPTLTNPISKQIATQEEEEQAPATTAQTELAGESPLQDHRRDDGRRAKQVLQASRMKGQKEQAAALARDLQRQQEVQRAFEAVDDGSGTLVQGRLRGAA